MGSRRSLMLWLGLSGCGNLLGIENLSGPSGDASTNDGTPPIDGPAAECKAQRLVHIVAGSGGLAWFTLAWPVPAVITSFSPVFAYDNPALANDLTTDPMHPLFARSVGAHAIWQGPGRGTDPQPSVFIAGTNETHTNTPTSNSLSGAVGLDAAAASLQLVYDLEYRVVIVGAAGPYGSAPNAPIPVAVTNADGAISLLISSGSVTDAEIRPSSAQLASYLPMGGGTGEVALATSLAIAANAFRHNLLGTLVLPAFNDDPHNAFDTGVAGQRANNLATMLDAFYADLATGVEAACGHNGAFVSLADNVVTVVTGDTPKNPLMATMWPDGTPSNANYVYMRSNGFTKPGWFGQIDAAGARSTFDPNTGLLDGTVSGPIDTQAAFAANLYAVARGDLTAVKQFTNASFAGLIKQ